MDKIDWMMSWKDWFKPKSIPQKIVLEGKSLDLDVENYNKLFRIEWKYRNDFLCLLKSKGKKYWEEIIQKPDDIVISRFENIEELNNYLVDFGINAKEIKSNNKRVNPFQRDIYIDIKLLPLNRKLNSKFDKLVSSALVSLLLKNHISFIRR